MKNEDSSFPSMAESSSVDVFDDEHQQQQQQHQKQREAKEAAKLREGSTKKKKKKPKLKTSSSASSKSLEKTKSTEKIKSQYDSNQVIVEEVSETPKSKPKKKKKKKPDTTTNSSSNRSKRTKKGLTIENLQQTKSNYRSSSQVSRQNIQDVEAPPPRELTSESNTRRTVQPGAQRVNFIQRQPSASSVSETEHEPNNLNLTASPTAGAGAGNNDSSGPLLLEAELVDEEAARRQALLSTVQVEAELLDEEQIRQDERDLFRQRFDEEYQRRQKEEDDAEVLPTTTTTRTNIFYSSNAGAKDEKSKSRFCCWCWCCPKMTRAMIIGVAVLVVVILVVAIAVPVAVLGGGDDNNSTASSSQNPNGGMGPTTAPTTNASQSVEECDGDVFSACGPTTPSPTLPPTPAPASAAIPTTIPPTSQSPTENDEPSSCTVTIRTTGNALQDPSEEILSAADFASQYVGVNFTKGTNSVGDPDHLVCDTYDNDVPISSVCGSKYNDGDMGSQTFPWDHYVTIENCEKVTCSGRANACQNTRIEQSNHVVCKDVTDCLNSTISMVGEAPLVECLARKSCRRALITADSSSTNEHLRVNCLGNQACEGAFIDAGGSDRGTVICSGGPQGEACHDGTLIIAKCLVCNKKSTDPSLNHIIGCDSGLTFNGGSVPVRKLGYCGDCTGVPEASGLQNIC